MGQLQRMWAEAYPYDYINGQKWFIEASKGCYNAERNGNSIYIHFDVKDFNKLKDTENFKALEKRNISCTVGADWMPFISVSYNFKDETPRRKNSRKEVILD